MADSMGSVHGCKCESKVTNEALKSCLGASLLAVLAMGSKFNVAGEKQKYTLVLVV